MGFHKSMEILDSLESVQINYIPKVLEDEFKERKMAEDDDGDDVFHGDDDDDVFHGAMMMMIKYKML